MTTDQTPPMPEITDLKAGSVPTEEELLGLLEKAEALLPLTFEPHNAFGALGPDGTPYPLGYLTAEQPIFGLDVFLEYDPAELNSLAALIVAAVNRLPSLIAAKAQAEARVKELEEALAQSTGVLHSLRGGLDLEPIIAGNLALLPDFSWAGREQIADPLVVERQYTERVCEARDQWERRAQAAEAENARLREALTEIADESVFNQQRFAEDTDTDYFLRCFAAVKDRARSALQQKGGGL